MRKNKFDENKLDKVIASLFLQTAIQECVKTFEVKHLSFVDNVASVQFLHSYIKMWMDNNKFCVTLCTDTGDGILTRNFHLGVKSGKLCAPSVIGLCDKIVETKLFDYDIAAIGEIVAYDNAELVVTNQIDFKSVQVVLPMYEICRSINKMTGKEIYPMFNPFETHDNA